MPDSDAGDHEYGTDSFDFLDLTVLDDPFFVIIVPDKYIV